MKNSQWQDVAHQLREELSAYGGVLHLFTEQQRSILYRDAESVLRYSNEIEARVPELAEHRRRRTEAIAQLAAIFEQPPQSTLRALLPFIEPVARPLLEALIGEVNRLLFKLRRLTRHNQTLLAKILEVRSDIVRQLKPTDFSSTYAANGRSRGGLAAFTSLQAAG